MRVIVFALCFVVVGATSSEAQTQADSLSVLEYAMAEWFSVAENFNPRGNPVAFCFQPYTARLGFVPDETEGVTVSPPSQLQNFVFDLIETAGFERVDECVSAGDSRRNLGFETPDGRPAIQMTFSGLHFESPDRVLFAVGYYNGGAGGHGYSCAYNRMDGRWSIADRETCTVWWI